MQLDPVIKKVDKEKATNEKQTAHEPYHMKMEAQGDGTFLAKLQREDLWVEASAYSPLNAYRRALLKLKKLNI